MKHAIRDATRVRDTFVQLGSVRRDHAILLEEPSASGLMSALDRAAAIARTRRPTEVTLVVYFSGHGDRKSLHLGGERVALSDVNAKLACSAEPRDEDPLEATEDDLSVRQQMLPIREALFAIDHDNDIWFECKAGSGGSAVTFTVSPDRADRYWVTARCKKASFYTGYVDSTFRVGRATLSGEYPHRIFAFSIGGKAARIEANLPDGQRPFLFFQEKQTKLTCAEYDAPYAVTDPFGPPP